MIFVFGSNVAGIHGKGAALTAKTHHGAIQGQGEGLMGQSYGIPTKWTPWEHMKLWEIEKHVQRFIEFAHNEGQHLTFQVTQIGTGLAGNRAIDIVPMFLGCPDNCLFDEAWREYLGATKRYWGTFP